jgi:hypothetical protein
MKYFHSHNLFFFICMKIFHPICTCIVHVLNTWQPCTKKHESINEWFLHDFHYQIMGWEVCDVSYDHNHLTSLQVKHWPKYMDVKVVNRTMSYHFLRENNYFKLKKKSVITNLELSFPTLIIYTFPK